MILRCLLTCAMSKYDEECSKVAVRAVATALFTTGARVTTHSRTWQTSKSSRCYCLLERTCERQMQALLAFRHRLLRRARGFFMHYRSSRSGSRT